MKGKPQHIVWMTVEVSVTPFCVIACHPVISHSVIAYHPVTSHSVIACPSVTSHSVIACPSVTSHSVIACHPVISHSVIAYHPVTSHSVIACPSVTSHSVIACPSVTSHAVIACHPVISHSVIVWPPSGRCQHAVFNLLLVASLKNMAALLDRHMPPQGKGPSRRTHLTTAVRQYLRDLVVVSGHWSDRLVRKDSLVPPLVHCLSC